MFFIFRFFPTQRADIFVRFLMWSHVTPCFYCQSTITKSQFCRDVSVSDVGDLVKVILAPVIIYCFDFFSIVLAFFLFISTWRGNKGDMCRTCHEICPFHPPPPPTHPHVLLNKSYLTRNILIIQKN